VSALLRSNITVAAGTALSRLSGLLRVAVFAYVIGQTFVADAYSLANETPNIVYDLLLGGVLSATLIPLFTSFLGADEGGDGEADPHATNVIITIATTLMVALTAVAVVAAPVIFRLYSLDPADEVDADLFRQVGTTLTRIFLLQILFYGLAGLANAYLNSRRRFFAAAWSPILPNVIIIVTLLSLPGAGDTSWTLDDVIDDSRVRWTLGLGATAGIAAMALVLIPAAIRAGLRFRPAFEWRHPAVRKLLVLSAWTIGFVAANQVALIVVRNLAVSQGEGVAKAYFDAFTLFVLPHGLLAVSIATTFQPEMARAVTRRDRADFVHHASLGTRLIALLTQPAAAGMFVLRDPIIGLLFQRGQFDATDAYNTSRAVAGLAIGLAGFSVYLFVIRGFYAHQDTRTPFVLNVGENLLNVVLAFVFVERWGVLGLGLAFGLAYVVSSGWALQVLSYKVPGFALREIGSSLWRIVLATVLAAEAMWLAGRLVDGTTGTEALGRIALGGSAGVAVYVAALLALRPPELQFLRHRLRPSHA
jgi:putative peptidoglycan lipid II flippase